MPLTAILAAGLHPLVFACLEQIVRLQGSRRVFVASPGTRCPPGGRQEAREGAQAASPAFPGHGSSWELAFPVSHKDEEGKELCWGS